MRLINNPLNRPEAIPRRIKRWDCHKLECFADYIDAYTGSLTDTECYYVELYAGGGKCLCEGTDCCIEDSSLRALRSRTKFAKYIFVVRDHENAESLQQQIAPDNTNDIEIIADNCNREKGIRHLLDIIPRSASSFAFIDPGGYRRLRWSTIRKLAAHSSDWKGRKMDLLLIFPLEMALLRNLTRPECAASITRLYGNYKWQEIKQKKLDGEIGLSEGRHQLVGLFKAGLKSLGYKHVEDFKPASFSRQPFYHLILASDRNRATEILEDAWGKPRYLPCELLYSKEANIRTDIKWKYLKETG